jgi:FixJ family two-component response regulator
MERPLIAIVDDDESVRDATERLMRSAGFSAETFSRGADFLSSPDLSRTACLVTDLNMPGMSGFDLHRRLQSLGRSIPTVLITGQPNENVRTQALSLGIICYLPKPFRDDDLIDSIHSALRSHAPTAERTLDLARMFTGELESRPGIREQPGSFTPHHPI